MRIADRLLALQRTYPKIGPAQFLHSRASDLKRRGRAVVLIMVVRSGDGRYSIHRTQFSRAKAMSVNQWADWLESNAPDILANQVLAYLNRSFGSIWMIDRIVGWHFVKP